MQIEIDLCDSGYDTKVFVYEATCTDPPIRCDDDSCGSTAGYTSILTDVELTAGVTYYIVIDGYGSSSGVYTLTIDGEYVDPDAGACCLPDGSCELVTRGVCLYSPGDLDCSGSINFDDIDPFVLALVSQSGYESQYPDCNYFNGDIDGNGIVNFDDIDGFVDRLVLGGPADPTGDWLGVGTDCSMCPCIVLPPAGAIEEGEPDCYDDFDDAYNGGCNSEPPVFLPINCSETYYGTSGTFAVRGCARPRHRLVCARYCPAQDPVDHRGVRIPRDVRCRRAILPRHCRLPEPDGLHLSGRRYGAVRADDNIDG